MIPAELRLPEEAHVVGAVYPPGDLRLLKDGMLHVGLFGLSIDVSWFPEHDPEGEYIVSVYQDEWENQLLEPFATRDVTQVVAFVQQVAADALARSV